MERIVCGNMPALPCGALGHYAYEGAPAPVVDALGDQVATYRHVEAEEREVTCRVAQMVGRIEK